MTKQVITNEGDLRIETGYEKNTKFMKVYDENNHLTLSLPDDKIGNFLSYIVVDDTLRIAIYTPEGPCEYKYTKAGLVLLEKIIH